MNGVAFWPHAATKHACPLLTMRFNVFWQRLQEIQWQLDYTLRDNVLKKRYNNLGIAQKLLWPKHILNQLTEDGREYGQDKPSPLKWTAGESKFFLVCTREPPPFVFNVPVSCRTCISIY
jgi:hypothetical protein